MARNLLSQGAMVELEGGVRFDAEEYLRRWEQARRAALAVAVPTSIGAAPPVGPAIKGEEELLRDSLAEDKDGTGRDTLLRAVFDNSRRLALGLSRRLGLTFELQDFKALLVSSKSPCYSGNWSLQGGAHVLRRPGCADGAGAGTLACDYWREALDGLVTGLGERERLARHGCSRRGDAACVDVLFAESDTVGGVRPAWGPVPEHLAIDLYEAVEYFRGRTGMSVGIKGVNEGVLHYELITASDAACAGGGRSPRFQDILADRLPGLQSKDVTPQAVLGEHNA